MKENNAQNKNYIPTATQDQCIDVPDQNVNICETHQTDKQEETNDMKKTSAPEPSIPSDKETPVDRNRNTSANKKKPDKMIVACVYSIFAIAVIGALLIWHNEAIVASIRNPEKKSSFQTIDPLRKILKTYSKETDENNYTPIAKTKKPENFKESNKEEIKKESTLSYAGKTVKIRIPDNYVSKYSATFGDATDIEYFSDKDNTMEIICSYGHMPEKSTPESLIKAMASDRPDLSINSMKIENDSIWYYTKESDNKKTEFCGIMENQGNQYCVQVYSKGNNDTSLEVEEIRKFFRLTN